MNATYFLKEKTLDNGLLLFNTVTFDYIILDNKNKLLWENNEFERIDVVDILKNMKILFDNIDEKEEFENNVLKLFSKKDSKINPIYFINMINFCNLKCPYCYSGYERKFKPLVMSFEQIDNIVDILVEASSKSNVVVHLIGGEPLLPVNMNNVEYFFSKIKIIKNIKVNIITNACYIKEYIDILKNNKEKISNIQITLNGNRSNHNQLRKDSKGNGTFDVSMDATNLLLKEGFNKKITLAIIIDKKSVTNVPLLFDDLESKGFLDKKKLNIVFGKIQFRTDYDCDGYSVNVIPTDEYFPTLIKLKHKDKRITYDMINGSEASVLGDLYRSKYNDKIIMPNFKGCSAIYPGRLAFYPDGYVYACPDVIGMENFRIGTFDNGLKLNDSYLKWKKYNPIEVEKCNGCKYIGMCNGGCAVSNIVFNGDINKIKCFNMDLCLDKYLHVLKEVGEL